MLPPHPIKRLRPLAFSMFDELILNNAPHRGRASFNEPSNRFEHSSTAMSMAGQPDAQPNDPVVAAIESVLKAERDGVERLHKSAVDAEHLLSETRAQAATLARRADRCISRLQKDYLQKIERDIHALAQTHADTGAGRQYDQATLAAAARRIAAKLTGDA